MARVAAAKAQAHTGLYGMLWDREELAARNGGRVVQASGKVYDGDSQRLAAFRAGAPVHLRASTLPSWARGEETAHWWRRATVTADGAVSFYNDDGSAWLAENGL